MQIHGRHSIGSLLMAVYVSIAVSTPVSAMDSPPAAVATVTFHDIDPNPGVRYNLHCVVELVGTDKKLKTNSDVGAGITGNALCNNIDHLMESQGWTCKCVDNKLVIEGWKDPKTDQFHKIKKVTFTSPDLPKNQMPKVTNPEDTAVIEFVGVSPQPKHRYDLRLVIELVRAKPTTVKARVGSGSSAKALAILYGLVLKQREGWQYTVLETKLVIEGWKDPKTGTFHKVKKVTFTSPDLPKDLMPKVTNPKRPIA